MSNKKTTVGTIAVVNADGSYDVLPKGGTSNLSSIANSDYKTSYSVGDVVNIKYYGGKGNIPFIDGGGVYK